MCSDNPTTTRHTHHDPVPPPTWNLVLSRDQMWPNKNREEEETWQQLEKINMEDDMQEEGMRVAIFSWKILN